MNNHQFMSDEMFADLRSAVQEMVEIEQGLREPATVRVYERPNPRQVRQKLKQTQAQFAQTLGVSKSLVQSWEQNRRTPEGASLKILRVLDKQPELVEIFQAV